MCNNDKQSFLEEIKRTQASIKKMSTPVKFTATMAAFDIERAVLKYTTDVNSMSFGKVTSAEKTDNQYNLKHFIKDAKRGYTQAENAFTDAQELRNLLIK